MDGTVPYLSRTSGYTPRSQYGLVRVRLELRGLRDLRKLFPVLNKRSGNGDCVRGVATYAKKKCPVQPFPDRYSLLPPEEQSKPNAERTYIRAIAMKLYLCVSIALSLLGAALSSSLDEYRRRRYQGAYDDLDAQYFPNDWTNMQGKQLQTHMFTCTP